MSRLFRLYESLLHRYPIVSQSIQTGLLVTAGDVISQTVVEKKPLKNIEYKRTLQFFAIGTFYVGPALSVWYTILHKYVGTGGKWFGVKKMAADQICFAPVLLGGFLVGINTLQGQSSDQIKKTFKTTYLEILFAGYKLWPAAQLINFYVVPLHFQVLYVQVIALFWNTYVCYKTRPNESVLT